MFDFTDKVVIVTGAAGNLGMACVHKFAQAGANIAAVDRNDEILTNAFPEFVDNPRHVLVPCIDITDKVKVDEAANTILETFGRADVLVNTVGGYRAGTALHQTPVEDWEFLINLNARSVFLSCQAFIPTMLAQNSGKIINISASAGLQGRAKAASFSASKSAVLRLTESLSDEVKRQGINVNAIIPGAINTPQNREAFPDLDPASLVAPASLADAIAFLASDLAGDIHGAVLPVLGSG